MIEIVHDQKINKTKYELFEKCNNNTHDYCCGDYENDFIGHEDECNPVTIIVFLCGCKAYIKKGT